VVAFSATYAIGVCLFELVTGRHPGLLGIAIPAAGALSGIGAVRVFQAATRKIRDTPTDHHGEPDYQAVPGLAPEVVILVNQGRKIQAIKRYRELNPGIGLKEAKDVID
jgi:ribosomal protein L7/L12